MASFATPCSYTYVVWLRNTAKWTASASSIEVTAASETTRHCNGLSGSDVSGQCLMLSLILGKPLIHAYSHSLILLQLKAHMQLISNTDLHPILHHFPVIADYWSNFGVDRGRGYLSLIHLLR